LELRNIPPHLMIVSPRVDFIDLRVSGPRTLLSRIDAERLAIVLDLSGVRPGPAVFRILTEALNLPRGVAVVRVTPSEVTLDLERVARKTVAVHLTLTGKPPSGLRVTDSKVAPEVVEVIGPTDEVEQIKQAETVAIDLSQAEPGLIEREVGLETPREYVSFSASRVHAQVQLEEPEQTRAFTGVPIVVRNAVYRTTVTPATVRITVRGPRSTTELLELDHGAVYIDAAGLEPGGHTATPSVDLPADVELVKQEPTSVKLRVLREKRKING
jgi:YbbR domain-containing protein